jgi:hypothetical protein
MLSSQTAGPAGWAQRANAGPTPAGLQALSNAAHPLHTRFANMGQPRAGVQARGWRRASAAGAGRPWPRACRCRCHRITSMARSRRATSSIHNPCKRAPCQKLIVMTPSPRVASAHRDAAIISSRLGIARALQGAVTGLEAHAAGQVTAPARAGAVAARGGVAIRSGRATTRSGRATTRNPVAREPAPSHSPLRRGRSGCCWRSSGARPG